MYYVYVLKSLKHKRVYVGYSADLRKRLGAHNNGDVTSTKGYRPWVLVYYEACLAKTDATKREKQLKEHAAKDALLGRIRASLNETEVIE